MSCTDLPQDFGPYRLREVVAEGGMATIFLAEALDQPSGAPPVVLKRLHEDLVDDAEAAELFLTEADLSMMIDHPNIVRAIDSGQVGRRTYICFEYVHGRTLESLNDLLRTGHEPLATDTAVHIAIEILEALNHLHRLKSPNGKPLGAIHRDVTPSNMFLTQLGELKLGDFGVAKLMGIEDWSAPGSLKGKLGYFSPEQVRGEPPTQSIDLWAAAVVFYELLCGRHPFAVASDRETLQRIASGKLRAPSEIPKVLTEFLKRALHRHEDKRFRSAAEMLVALETFRELEGRLPGADTRMRLATLVRQLDRAL